ncbi:MAG: hypothetical protein Ta2B_30340 [Termitinemataceae bacterium]|nr:MAG: hypothetical protein Ta2B_30340 [Termitinemataceae bacterium]
MKKIIAMFFLTAFAVLPCMAGEQVSLEEALRIFQADVDNYPRAILRDIQVTPDGRRDTCEITRFTWEDSAFLALFLIRGGSRYEFQITFFKKKQPNDKRSFDQKQTILRNLQMVLPPNWEDILKMKPAVKE